MIPYYFITSSNYIFCLYFLIERPLVAQIVENYVLFVQTEVLREFSATKNEWKNKQTYQAVTSDAAIDVPTH